MKFENIEILKFNKFVSQIRIFFVKFDVFINWKFKFLIETYVKIIFENFYFKKIRTNL